MNPSTLLGLMQLASPALPVGGFSYSEALESAVDQGVVRDEKGALAWLVDQLHLGLGRAELPLVAAAHAAWAAADTDAVQALNTWLLTTRETSELRAQNEQMGRSMAEWIARQWPADGRAAMLRALAPAPAWPIAFALAAAAAGAGASEAALAYGFSWAENQVQAAVKAVPLGQAAGQRLLGALAQAMPALAAAAPAVGEADRQAFMPMFAIRSAQHETQYSRLFRS